MIKHIFKTSYILFFLLMIVPFSAHAGGAHYDACKKKLSGKFSAVELERGCSCSQKKADKYRSQGIKPAEFEKIIFNCFTNSMQTMAERAFYKDCMDNFKEKNKPAYKRYCRCMAKAYALEMKKRNAFSAMDKSLREKISNQAAKAAVQKCIPKKEIKMKNKSTLTRVQEFHETYGLPVLDAPAIADEKTNALRINLLAEELDELKEALAQGDMVETLDALIDLQYVLDGAFLSFGMQHLKEPAFDEVHCSNMSKLGADGKPIRRESDGKILKGSNYFKPDLVQFIVNKEKAA